MKTKTIDERLRDLEKRNDALKAKRAECETESVLLNQDLQKLYAECNDTQRAYVRNKLKKSKVTK
jgi:chromosome segregation ATPase